MAHTNETFTSENLRGRADFVKDIHGKSDRAVAIVAAALLNAHLEQLLAGFFVDDEREIRALLDGDRAAGTFGTRIRLAYLLGLISAEEHADLWAIGQIEAVCAREMGELSFTDLPMRGWCLDMRLPNKIMLSGEMRTPRRMFVFTAALLLRQLALRIDAAEAERRESPDPFRLVDVE